MAATRRVLCGFQDFKPRAGGYGVDSAFEPRRIDTRARKGCADLQAALEAAAADSHRWYFITIFIVLEKVMEDGPLPDLRDIELKLGRSAESLVRSLRGGGSRFPPERDRDPRGERGAAAVAAAAAAAAVSLSPCRPPLHPSQPLAPPRPSHSSSTLERLETKLHLLRQEMVSVVRRLWSGNPGSKTREVEQGREGDWGGRAEGWSAWETLVRGVQRAHIWM